MKKVIVIVGPTASGKTMYSVKLAKAIGAEIINGDSVQVYKELNIGSAKIKEEEKEGIDHHLFDMVSIDDDYSVFNFQQDARKMIKDIKIPMIVGGTGFYIKSALYDYEFNKESSKYNFDDLSNEEIYHKLIEIDKNIEIDKSNRHRLVRALELALSGNLRSEKNNKNIPLYDILTIYLDIDRKELKERLIKRLDIQLQDGFIEEVMSLRNQNKHLNIIGYRELDLYLDGKVTLAEAKEEIVKVSMRFAKRQKTWFMNQMEAIPFDPLNPKSYDEMLEVISKFLKEE